MQGSPDGDLEGGGGDEPSPAVIVGADDTPPGAGTLSLRRRGAPLDPRGSRPGRQQQPVIDDKAPPPASGGGVEAQRQPPHLARRRVGRFAGRAAPVDLTEGEAQVPLQEQAALGDRSGTAPIDDVRGAAGVPHLERVGGALVTLGRATGASHRLSVRGCCDSPDAARIQHAAV